MKIGIIFAMQSEYEAFLEIKDKVVSTNEFECFVCGIGKVNASVATTKAILESKCDFIINCGVAGGINDSKQFEVYIGTDLIYSDVDVTVFGYEMGRVPSMPKCYNSSKADYSFSNAKFAKVLTQDTFASDSHKLLFKEQFFDYKAVDMESCAIAQSCYVLNKDFVIIRCISDLVFEPNNHLSYQDSEKKAAKIAAETLVELLEQI